MLKKPAAVTASAPNRQKNSTQLILGILLIIAGVFAVVRGVSSLSENPQRLIAPKALLSIEIASTQELRTLGLSTRSDLGEKSGLLFVFDDISSNNCFWMKDMKFSIDMIWLDADKNVVTVTKNVAPETFPTSFCPEKPAKYGLEIGANLSDDYGIEQGKQLRF